MTEVVVKRPVHPLSALAPAGGWVVAVTLLAVLRHTSSMLTTAVNASSGAYFISKANLAEKCEDNWWTITEARVCGLVVGHTHRKLGGDVFDSTAGLWPCSRHLRPSCIGSASAWPRSLGDVPCAPVNEWPWHMPKLVRFALVLTTLVVLVHLLEVARMLISALAAIGCVRTAARYVATHRALFGHVDAAGTAVGLTDSITSSSTFGCAAATSTPPPPPSSPSVVCKHGRVQLERVAASRPPHLGLLLLLLCDLATVARGQRCSSSPTCPAHASDTHKECFVKGYSHFWGFDTSPFFKFDFPGKGVYTFAKTQKDESDCCYDLEVQGFMCHVVAADGTTPVRALHACPRHTLHARTLGLCVGTDRRLHGLIAMSASAHAGRRHCPAQASHYQSVRFGY